MARYENRDKLTQKLTATSPTYGTYFSKPTIDTYLHRKIVVGITTDHKRGNNANFKLESNRMDRKQQSTHGNGIQQKRTLPKKYLQTGHPVIRDVDTYSDPAVALTMINTGLSLDLSHTSPELSPKKDCVEKITGSVESLKTQS